VDLNIKRTHGRVLISLVLLQDPVNREWNFGVYKNGEEVKQLSGYLLIKSGFPHLSEWVRKIMYNMAILRDVLFYKDTTTTRQLRLKSLR